MLNILIADDDEGDRKLVIRALKEAAISFQYAESVSVEEALSACDKSLFDCAIIDYRMPGNNGLFGVAALHERLPFMPIIMATGQGDEKVATEAMKLGAADYIAKRDINAKSIAHIIENAVEKNTLRRKVAEQREELENFARVLVHDLKAPIRSIQGFVRYIERSNAQCEPEKADEYCRLVFQAARRMDVLIDTLRQYTQADKPVVFEAVEMDRVIKAALFNLHDSIDARGARITHGELPAVLGDASQLTQLLQNLIANGIKYCEAEKPSMRVTAEPQDANTWLFTVKDNGVGIPEEYYESAFEAFRRLPNSANQEGTGLGLATCKKIIERHGGAIRCASKNGEGTSFFFTLPGTGWLRRIAVDPSNEHLPLSPVSNVKRA
jgi:light-regulated signal transduction histidine kinase (bacteriophytochrome)